MGCCETALIALLHRQLCSPVKSERQLPCNACSALRSCTYAQEKKAIWYLQADKYMQQWRFPNTYCFSKHLAESLMASCHSTAFPVAIVRPSIIGGLAGTPLPGYVGNTAGSTGAALAIATGQLPCVTSYQLWAPWDSMYAAVPPCWPL